MRVLVHAPAARMGGARAHVLGLLPELARLGPADDYLVVAQPDLLGDLPPLPANWEHRAEQAQDRGFLARLLWEQLALPRIAARWRADVLLSFGSFIPLRPGCATVLEAGNALPFSRHYWQLLRQEPLGLWADSVARWALLSASLQAATRILAPTRSMRQDLVASLPSVADRVDVVPWGVADLFHARTWSEPPADVVLGVSKHGMNKEFDVLVAALPPLLARWPGLRLKLTGTPEESRWARRTAELAGRLGVAERVDFVGAVPNGDVPRLIEEARLLVFPTWCESFGLPLAEALAMGAPALAADIPACREVGGEAACYYQPGSARSLSDAIACLLGDAALRQRYALAARARGAGFQWSANAAGVRRTLALSLGAR